jgi:predicted  nucleic acid-binding Zn-ribbon protein
VNPQLRVLIALQDIILLLRDAQDPGQKRVLGKMGLKIDKMETLESTKEELENQLSPALLGEYRRATQRHGRIVAPVIGSVCYQCFVRIPSAIDSADDRNTSLYRCENCGMFLYWVDK